MNPVIHNPSTPPAAQVLSFPPVSPEKEGPVVATPGKKQLEVSSGITSSATTRRKLLEREIDYIAFQAAFSDADVIGVGGFGRTIKVTVSKPEEQVYAVKVCVSSTKAEFEMNLQEAKYCQQWHHKNLVESFGYTRFRDNTTYLIMPLYQENLQSKIFFSSRSLDDKATTKISLGMIEGLTYLHGEGYLHGDLKTDNVLLQSDGNPRLADFGYSCKIDAPHIIAIPGKYLAPELSGYQAAEKQEDGSTSLQKRGQNGLLSVQADIYGMAYLLTCLHTRAIYTECWGVVNGGAKCIIRIPREYKEFTQRTIYTEIITPALESNPKKRPQSMLAIRAIALKEADDRAARNSEGTSH